MEKYIKPNLSENALTVLERRYFIKDKQGRVIETPRELFVRVAKFIALADSNYGADADKIEKSAFDFYEMMAQLKFLPNSPTLMNAGRELGQLSACFVLPVEDSMEDIFETNKHAALIHKTGGGTGFSFSRLRPRDSIVASTSGVASGPVSFMKVFNSATEAVKQGGTRRGANMGVLRVDHPDILEFITCKDDHNELKNFNISVAITDQFMEALQKGASYPLINPFTGKQHLIREGDDDVLASLDAKEIFGKIVEHAWNNGEPGIIFIDRMNQKNPTYPYEQIESTNPCGEQPLPPYDSCNLGSINLGKFIKTPLPSNYVINNPADGILWNELAVTIRQAIHFLDNVIDQNKYPLEQIQEQTKLNRRIGLGIMGWADMLVQLKLPYNSEPAFELGREVMAFVNLEARKHSSELSKSRGKFPNWENSIYEQENISMRNCTVSTIAPTGTISIIAGCSSGIEPYYAIAFERNVMDGTKLIEVNPLFKKIAQKENFYTEDIIQKVKSNLTLKEIKEIPDSVKALFLTASDISPEEHIKMQSIFQENCDSSVSKTINFHEKASRDDVRTAFLKAFELGCKGVTVYRNMSRPDQVLSTSIDKAVDSSHFKVLKRPSILTGFTEKIKTGYGNLYVTVNLANGKPFEIFAQIGKSGFSTMADTEAICRLISMLLRSGVGVKEVIHQLRGIGGSSQIYANGTKITSIPDAIAQILNRHFGESKDSDKKHASNALEMCPDCAGSMIYDSGCFSCQFCGYSNC